MKILLSSSHRYPAGGIAGTGLAANPRTTGGAAFVHDNLAKGLAELGHEVYCHLRDGYDPPLPAGIRPIEGPPRGVDVLHQINSWFFHSDWPTGVLSELDAPWVASCHVVADRDDRSPGHLRGQLPPNWIAVSETLARAYAHDRFVLNGVAPDDLIYSGSKEAHFLFACRADVAEEKGLGLALELSREAGFPLTVMAGSTSDATMHALDARCREAGARFVGDLRGRRKAELLAGARALLLPTSLDEGGPLLIAEAIMSGTPVIASPRGACPEMVTPDVGYICTSRDDYFRAIDRIDSIRPEDCRRRAIERFHHLKMAREYVAEYRREIASYAADRAGYIDRSLSHLMG